MDGITQTFTHSRKMGEVEKIEFYYAKLLEKHVCNQMDFQKFHKKFSEFFCHFRKFSKIK